jgi:membrane protein required for colicin V production
MHFSQWNFLDYVFALIILVSIGFAVMKGLVREIVSLVALIAGFVLAAIYYPAPARYLIEYCRTEAVANLLGYVIIFVGCILLGAIVAFVVNRFLKAASIKWVDRLLGGIFGLLRGWAVCSVLVIALIAFPIREKMMTQSFLAPYILAGARAAVHLVPQGLKNKFDEQYKKVVQTWNESRSES